MKALRPATALHASDSPFSSESSKAAARLRQSGLKSLGLGRFHVAGRLVRWTLLLAGTTAFHAGISGCSSPAKPGGAGDSCLVLTDCAEGLVCAPTSPSTMKCSASTVSLVQTEDSGASGAASKTSEASDASAPAQIVQPSPQDYDAGTATPAPMGNTDAAEET